MSLLTADCTPKCRSLQHALDMISVLTKGTEGQNKAFLSSYCYNAASLKDSFGRTTLHMAASCGKKAVVDWLLEKRGADPSVKDKESGWTALHRSIFYGHIDCAVSLLKHGSTHCVHDKDGLSTLDLAMKDRPSYVIYRKTDPTEVYTWGNNTNFTLGHGSQQSKYHPELVDFFPRSGVYIKQVVLCKFHSVFLSQKGQIYTCGHGQGGRLGHGDEQTYLVPRMVEGLANHCCAQVAAAKDHTVVLTEDGSIYTFGVNTYFQLGIVPPPAISSIPRQVQSKTLKGRTVIGVAAGRFHTVLWTKEAVYTMGLNGGQLGCLMDPNGERCVLAPRQVSALHHKDTMISLAVASDGATISVTEKGDVYLLTDYQCKKIASRQLNLRKVLVTGGHLDHKADPQVLKESGGEKVCMLALDEAGRVFCWRSSNCFIKQCRWAYGRQVFMSDITLSKNEMMFVTQDGDGFIGHWTGTEKKDELSSILQSSDQSVTSTDVSSSLYERIKLEKLSSVHRAVLITMDSNGRNFAVLQSDPKTSLYEIPSVSSSTFTKDFGKLLTEASETDSIHDVTCQVINQIFPAHKYILAMRSDYFRKCFFPESQHSELPDIRLKEDDAVGCDLYILDKVQPDLFTYLLQFIYTDTCDLLTEGYKPKIQCKDKMEGYQDPLISNLERPMQRFSFCNDMKGMSACEVYKKQQMNQPSGQNKTKNSKRNKGVNEAVNPVKMLQDWSEKFNYSYLSDVTLRSEDGKEFACHKCVLCARLEYFHSMLSSTWIEASCCTSLEMPIHSDILEVILDYIYTDEAPTVKECQNVEFICNVLVVADQLLITRLKEMCEVAITEKITLKNAAELLEFAATYNAEQLKLSCLQFIGLNVAALLEASKPFCPMFYISGIICFRDSLLKKAKAKAKKKLRRRSDSSGGYHLSDLIQSPTSTDSLRPVKTNSVESLQELMLSDSEGSYAGGAASPRELASPDFAAGFCHDISEVDERGHISEVMSPNEEMKMNEKTWTPKKESNPRSIPRSSSGSAVGWVACSLSPTSPSTVDLRAIMEMEENVQKRSILPKTNSRPALYGGKLSQKQRKMIAMAAKDPSTSSSPPMKSTMTPLTPSKTGNACPWVNAVANSPPAIAPVTFAAIVEEERQQEAALLKSKDKPLALIQIEEHAIQDLLIRYQAFDNPEEFIVIDRAPQRPIATPVWSKHRLL
uniref:Inhibitor of Bruton tyrosine kinase n=1 Tax=Callorhinchus milii TaxID=7868 RepID=A0A4W3J8Q6_CALMI